MLQAAVGQEADRVQASCVPDAAAAKWREGFTGAVETMMQKTKRTMQLGLASLARGVLMLIDESSSCGDLRAFQLLKEQAKRLEVLASTRSLAGLDASVKYEPLKSLTVGGIDVHLELNALLVAWQMKRGPGEVGSTLAKFLADFSADADDAPEAPEPEAAAEVVEHRPGSLQRKPQFWTAMLNQALTSLAAAPDRPVVEACISDGLAGFHADRFDEAFGRMMQKTQRSMQAGLRVLASTTQALLNTLQEQGHCPEVRSSQGVARLRLAANRLETLVGTRSLVNPGVKVKYEAMQMLTVGGLDVHLELNKLIGAWISDNRAEQVGDSLAGFFDDFKAKEEETEAEPRSGQEAAKAEPELVQMISDAVSGAGGGAAGSCFEMPALEAFARQVEEALEEMLKKRRKTMQQGLRELADAVSRLFNLVGTECRELPGVRTILQGAGKLRKLTRKTLVDYGAYIKYEALKSLEVGGVMVHTELNAFIAAWKLRSRREAGQPLGILFKRLSTISGHDEF
ncbi:unnamed protein product [Symbiodinium natans]|uniref:Uncharacterized protein n=1 Tax=Symbiodinium natans TaxID=878477 RepID=A0A812PYV7_9DINO|nr:unnamed protein product [Symbiodinium natans]